MSESDLQPRSRATRTILIIEDNASDLRLLEEAFTEADTETTLRSARTGDDAIDVLHRLERKESLALPDLVLTDLHLPGRDGQAVVEAIRNDLNLPNLPVVVLTRSEDSKDVQRCYEAQADAFLTKPTGFEELVVLVKRVESFWLKRETPPSVERSSTASADSTGETRTPQPIDHHHSAPPG